MKDNSKLDEALAVRDFTLGKSEVDPLTKKKVSTLKEEYNALEKERLAKEQTKAQKAKEVFEQNEQDVLAAFEARRNKQAKAETSSTQTTNTTNTTNTNSGSTTGQKPPTA